MGLMKNIEVGELPIAEILGKIGGDIEQGWGIVVFIFTIHEASGYLYL